MVMLAGVTRMLIIKIPHCDSRCCAVSKFSRERPVSVWETFSSGTYGTKPNTLDAPVVSQPPESSFINLKFNAQSHHNRQDELRTSQPSPYASGACQQAGSCSSKMGWGRIQGNPGLHRQLHEPPAFWHRGVHRRQAYRFARSSTD